MEVIVVGAGPTGLTAGAALARRGHRVVAVDPDPGPSLDGAWRRRGVMQFEHAHGFRPQVLDLLQREWPEAWLAWRELGAEPVELPGPGSRASVGVRSRRATYERALRRSATEVRGLTVAAGRVDRLLERGGRVVGAIVDGVDVPADLVIDASGRLSRLAGPVTLGGDTGMSYVSRNYRRRRDAKPGPMTSPVAWSAALRGYDAYVFPHDRGHIGAVIIRPTADPALGGLRHADAFDAAVRSIPGLDEWTDPRVAVPTSGVLVGGRLLNRYRPQLGRPGLVALGDALATTAPTAGRGVAMASMEIEVLLQMFDRGEDATTITVPFGAWCDSWIRPWVEDHLAMDSESVKRWQGVELDPSGALTSAAIVAAAAVEERIWPHIGAYLAMAALPASVAPAEPMARAVYQAGWRPPVADGPTRDELVTLAEDALAQPRAQVTARA